MDRMVEESTDKGHQDQSANEEEKEVEKEALRTRVREANTKRDKAKWGSYNM
jgi:hypothetical protein